MGVITLKVTNHKRASASLGFPPPDCQNSREQNSTSIAELTCKSVSDRTYIVRVAVNEIL